MRGNEGAGASLSCIRYFVRRRHPGVARPCAPSVDTPAMPSLSTERCHSDPRGLPAPAASLGFMPRKHQLVWIGAPVRLVGSAGLSIKCDEAVGAVGEARANE